MPFEKFKLPTRVSLFTTFKKCFNWRLSYTCFLLICSSFTWGFDNQGFATIQAMNSFQESFGEYNSKTHAYSLTTAYLSYLNSFQYLGFAAGLIFGSYVSDKFGRKVCIFTMSCIAVITGIITITSKHKEQMLCGRVLNYIYIGMEASSIPLLQSEITPYKARGFIVGAFQLAINSGGLIIHIITNATSTIDNEKAWKIPVGLFFIFPVFVGTGILLVNESPIWLAVNGKDEEALKSLRAYRLGKYSEENINQEFDLIKKTIVHESLNNHTYADLFKGVNFKRTLICIGINIFQQVTGQSFASQYGTVYIKSLGTVNAFKMSIGTSVVGIGSVLISLIFADQIGRKWFFRLGSWLQIGSLMAMGGLGTADKVTDPMKNGIVACMFIFTAAFSLGWAPLTYVVITEIPALKLRDKTQRVGFFFNILFAFIVAFTLPYLLNDGYANLQSKVGFIYGSFSVAAAVFVEFCIPECSGRTLAEIDFMFNKKVPIRQFRTYNIDEAEFSDYTIETHREMVEIHDNPKQLEYSSDQSSS